MRRGDPRRAPEGPGRDHSARGLRTGRGGRVIRLLLDPPRFECDTADEAAVLARLLGIRPPAPVPVVPIAAVGPKPAMRPATKFASRGPMKPTGHEKPCKKCGKAFPVLDRSDCPSVYCRACRPVQVPRKNPKAPTPAAGQPSVTRETGFPVVSCRNRTCGASVPSFETIDGLCLECAPMAARKRA